MSINPSEINAGAASVLTVMNLAMFTCAYLATACYANGRPSQCTRGMANLRRLTKCPPISLEGIGVIAAVLTIGIGIAMPSASAAMAAAALGILAAMAMVTFSEELSYDFGMMPWMVVGVNIYRTTLFVMKLAEKLGQRRAARSRRAARPARTATAVTAPAFIPNVSVSWDETGTVLHQYEDVPARLPELSKAG